MTQTPQPPRDWQKDMEMANKARTGFYGPETLPALFYWLQEAKEYRGLLDERNMRLDALEDRLVAAEAREQRLKETVETAIQLYDMGESSDVYPLLKDILRTLYPDTPAPTGEEGDNQ